MPGAITTIKRGSAPPSTGPGATTSSPPDRFETFARGVASAWSQAEGAIIDGLAGVRVNVRHGSAAVEATTQTLRGAVEEATDVTGWAFDVPARVRSHPWLALGGALLLGVALGQLSRRLWRQSPREKPIHE